MEEAGQDELPGQTLKVYLSICMHAQSGARQTANTATGGSAVHRLPCSTVLHVPLPSASCTSTLALPATLNKVLFESLRAYARPTPCMRPFAHLLWNGQGWQLPARLAQGSRVPWGRHGGGQPVGGLHRGRLLGFQGCGRQGRLGALRGWFGNKTFVWIIYFFSIW